MSVPDFIGIACGVWLLGWSMVLSWYRREIAAFWREPVLRYPVLIVESDDWGPGPACQVEILRALTTVALRFRDRLGQCPVITLGVILGIADAGKIRGNEFKRYARRTLGQSEYTPLVQVMQDGVASGTFSLQLHGMEHYWPQSLLAAARRDEAVSDWLHQTSIELCTEDLPASVQSRWVHGDDLPTQPLEAREIKTAAAQEVVEFERIFGTKPKVAVPPTFVWNSAVEVAWADAGVEVIVTPGRRCVGRRADGSLESDMERILTGQPAASGALYMVRDAYFEPMLGHTAATAADAFLDRTRLARPTLLEMHRKNYLGDPASRRQALREFEQLLSSIQRMRPDTVFLSTEALADRLRDRDPTLCDSALGVRMHYAVLRLAQIHRLRKLTWLSGAVLWVWIMLSLTRPAYPHSPRALEANR